MEKVNKGSDSVKVPKKLRTLSKQNPHKSSIVSVFRSLVTFSKQREQSPYFILVLEIIHNLIILARKPGRKYIKEIFEATQTALLLESEDAESVPGTILGKQQYVAVVGGLAFPVNQCIEVLRDEAKLSKKNIRIFNDIEAFKSGTYTEALASNNCVAIILGPVPHSHHENVEKDLSGKIVYARNNSGSHGKLHLTKTSLLRAIGELKQRKII